jgi:predicted ATPase/DNA-binding SARP family transcriptional activator
MGNVTNSGSKVASQLHARLLGQVSLSVGDRVIDDGLWPPRGGRSLLLLLLISPGHRLSRDRVLDALWPDLLTEAAQNAYYKALHSLRRTLEPELPARRPGRFLVATADALALAPGSHVVDIDAFENMLAGARKAPDESRAELLRAALDLYQGDLLENEPGLEWTLGRRESLRQTWQEASLQLAGLDLAQDRLNQAISRVRAIVVAEPTNEAAHCLLIRAFDRNGQRDLARSQYERCVKILRDELGVDPSVDTRRAADSVLGISSLDWPVRERKRRRWSNLPAPTTQLLGREREIEALQTMFLREEVRLITLTGAGGVGKTRLALEGAAWLVDEFADGVCFVPLATIRDPSLVLPSIAQALGPRDERASSIQEQVFAALRDRSALLVIDNFEQVLGVAPIVTDILMACPEVRVLVTSREPLHLRPERLLHVAPFDVPEFRAEGDSASLAQLARSAAVALFLERASAVSPGFGLSPENAVHVVRICARLDGLPLAIELAAARIREYSPHRLLALLDDRLGALVEGFQDLPQRQRTMRDTIGWSHDQLPVEQQMLFRRAAVCAGGCSVEMAAGLMDTPAPDAAALLQGLVDKSLMQWQPGTSERAEMLETTREFGLDRLDVAGETAFARDYLATFALELTAAAGQQLAGHEQGHWLDRLDADLDNLREALSWAIEGGECDRALTLVGNLWRYWWSRGHLSEGRLWLERALALPCSGDSSLRGFALNGAASLAESQGDFARAEELHNEALALWQSLNSTVGEARALSGIGTVAAHRGDYANARCFHERALELSRKAGDTAGAARTLDRLGTVARHQGDLSRAKAAYAESLALFQQNGDLVNASIVLSNLGEVLHRHGEAEQAAEHFEQALRLARELDLPDGIAFDLTNLARVRLELGEVDRAAALSAQGARLFRDMGNQLGLAGALAVCGLVAQSRGDFAEARRFLRETLRLLDELNEQSAIPENLEQLAAIVLEDGESERSVRLLGAASSMRERLASPPTPVERATIERTLAAAREVLGDHLTSRAFATGRALSFEGALGAALDDVPGR